MQFLLDDNKVLTIIGIICLLCVLVYLLPDKNKDIQQFALLTPTKACGIIDYDPRYFNNAIYSMPGSIGDPYMLYGNKFPGYNCSDSIANVSYERLTPTIDVIPLKGQIPAYHMQYLQNNISPISTRL
jgi:hypothetical protein